MAFATAFVAPLPLPASSLFSLKPSTPSRPLSRSRPRPNNPRASSETLPVTDLFLRGPVPGDRIVRTLSANGHVSARVLLCTGLVSGAARLHHTSPVASAAFGRTLASALLLASGKKDGETLQLEFRGDGPLRGVTAIANGDGEVRGYVGDGRVHIPPSAAGKLDVGRAVGNGILAVVRHSKYAKAPYTGIVPITTGEIAEDVAVYLADSEQTPSALGVGVYVDDAGNVTAAGGFLVQMLPGASEESIAIVERNVSNLGAPTDLVRQGRSADHICAAIMDGLDPISFASSSPRYHCKCSPERVRRTVGLIPEIEIFELLAKEGRIEACCEFCGRVWFMERPDVEQMIRESEVQAVAEGDEE